MLFLASLLLIVAASELFTNAVEWAGFGMRLASGATGSLLAALGTSLPETVVPVVALVSRAPNADAVAMGAVLGAPFLLLTLGVGVTGAAVAVRRSAPRLTVTPGQVRRDLGVFAGAYAVVLLSAALPHPLRIPIGICLLVTYAAYVRATLRGGAPAEEMPEPLHIVRWRRGRPHGVFIAIQLVTAIALLIVGSDLFVGALDRAASALHLNPLLVALVLIPVATELPETLNSVLWIRSHDDGLAFGNVAGSAAFQACVLGFIGVVFTSWAPSQLALTSGMVTVAVAVGLLVRLRHGYSGAGWLLAAGAPWVAYVIWTGLFGR